MLVYGTRPELLKLAPVVLALRAKGRAPFVLCTGQHPDLVSPIEQLFELNPDVRLPDKRLEGNLNRLLATLIDEIETVTAECNPATVIVQGDTHSALAAALVAFNQRIPIAHVEAGLRCSSLTEPFPEEANRRLISRITGIHFTPTARASEALRHEHVPADQIHQVGNTIVDALQYIRPQIVHHGSAGSGTADPYVVVTAHRRETQGIPLEGVIRAARQMHRTAPDLKFVWCLHPNPAISQVVRQQLGDCAWVDLVPPQAYPVMLGLLADAALVWTDSGGIQEEAPSFGTPVVVIRNDTERPELIDSGLGLLTGTDSDAILAASTRLLARPATALASNPFGDGQAAGRIARILTSP